MSSSSLRPWREPQRPARVRSSIAACILTDTRLCNSSTVGNGDEAFLTEAVNGIASTLR